MWVSVLLLTKIKSESFIELTSLIPLVSILEQFHDVWLELKSP